MKPITATAIALVTAALATPAAAQHNGSYSQPQQQTQQPSASQQSSAQPAAPTMKPSSKAAKAIYDLQTAVNNKDTANIPAKVAAAQAVATTKEDRYIIGSLELKAAADSNNAAEFSTALDAVAQTGVVEPTKLSALYGSLGGTYFKDKQFPQAVAAYQRSISLDPKNSDSQMMLGASLFNEGQKAEAAAYFQKAIQASTAAGQKPSEDLYKYAVQSAFDSKSPAATDLALQWLAAYPSPESWRNSIAVYRDLNQTDTEGTLDLMRLMQATGALNNPNDYGAYIEAAMMQNNYNEAQAALDAGIAAKVIDPASKDFHDLAVDVRGKAKASAADLEAAAKSAQTGTALLHIGDRYYSMGNYAKAVELYRTAQAKSDVDPNVAKLHIGMALARAGDKAGATAALNGVSGTRANIAKLWLAYVNQHA